MELVSEARVEALAGDRGYGVVHVDGFTVFLPHTVPGDLVRFAWHRPSKSWTEGRVVELLEPSPDRVPPACPHFPECGGCPWLVVSYDAQLRAKREILARALRIHHVEWDAPEVEPAGPSTNYRWRARFAVLDDGTVGFRRFGSIEPHPITTCAQLMFPDDVPLLGGLVRRGRQLHVQWAPDGRVSLHLYTGYIDLGTARERFGDRLAHVSVGLKDIHGAPPVLEEDPPFRAGAGGFTQPGPWANRALAQALLEMIRPLGSDLSILELYAGAGNFTRHLLRFGRVTAVESSEASIRLFRQNAPGARLVEKRVEFLDPSTFEPFDLLVLDPPREGLSKQAFRVIKGLTFRRIVLFSCDPMAGARDLMRFGTIHYRIKEMRAIDTMPNTPHFEMITLLERED